jgi:hypothetical protein
MNFTFLVQLVLDNAFCFLWIRIHLGNSLMFLIINEYLYDQVNVYF